MIMISKEEAMAVKKKFGDEVGVTITNRHKKGGRKKYYTEGSNRVLFFLERFRNKQVRQKDGKRGDRR